LKKKTFSSIKIGAFGDPHLTNRLPYTHPGSSYRKDRLKSFIDYSFRKFVKKEVDLIVVPGDVCHLTKLDSNDLELLIHFLDSSRISKIPTVIIPGNHDKDQQDCILQFLKSHSLSSGIHNLYYPHQRVGVWKFEFPTGVRVVGIEYCSDKDFLEEAKKGMNSDKRFYNILIAHVGIKGTLHGSTKSIFGIKKEEIKELEKGYDLIILAHHHLTQRITSKSFYCGSIQQTRIDEKDHVPGVLIFELPSLKITRIENKLSPRFKLVEDYIIKPEEIKDNIVKPVIDLQKFSEEEHVSFLKKILVYNPYYLIKPNLRKSYGEEIRLQFKKGDSKKRVLKRVLKRTLKSVSEKKAKEFNKHVLSLYRKVEGEKK